MKNAKINFCVIILITTIFYSCKEQPSQTTFVSIPDTTFVSIPETTFVSNLQTALVFVRYYYSGRRAPTWERITIPSIDAYGNISGNPLPTMNFFQICNKKFSDPSLYYYFQGNMHFMSYNRIWEDSVPEPKFNPIGVKINTDIGEIEGSITVPDTIKTLTISAGDSIALGTPVTISWSGSNADYYQVYFYHNWTIGVVGDTINGWGYLGYTVDTLIRGNSVTYDGSNFSNDGDISEFEVTPINGPFPESGAKPNLNGEGYGYLYLENKAIISYRTIIIGKGIDYSWFEKRAAPTSKHEESSLILQRKIRNRLGL
jgi:hypothetical protein